MFELQTVDLSNTPLGDAGCTLIADFLALPECSMIHVILKNCKMNSDGGKALGRALQHNDVTQTLQVHEHRLPIQV
jgi:Ran GTPase-activating protein (RanGAP) involved in mRNA processing and transport